jgi:hypothetical protein
MTGKLEQFMLQSSLRFSMDILSVKCACQKLQMAVVGETDLKHFCNGDPISEEKSMDVKAKVKGKVVPVL